MWVLDATSLIYLAKVDALHVVEALEGRCAIPQQVYDEVVTAGLDAGYADARRIERRVGEGTLEVVPVADTPLGGRLERNPNLSGADVAVLACAASRGGIAVMDEAAGRTVADVEGIETKGTAYIVLLGANREVISVAEARETSMRCSRLVGTVRPICIRSSSERSSRSTRRRSASPRLSLCVLRTARVGALGRVNLPGLAGLPYRVAR